MIKPLPVIILAGGLATRLHPVTKTIPKSLIEIQGEPFIAHQLRLLRKQGITDVIMCIGFLGEHIIDYVGDGHLFNLQVRYVMDGPVLLGTGGAIKKALPYIQDAFFVLYGDSYLPCDFKAAQNAFLASQKLALMTIFRNQGQWDTSNVEFSQGVLHAYDKINRNSRMHYIDYGLGLFHKNAFLGLPDNQAYDLATLYQELLRQNELACFEVKQRFYEVGSFTGIEELNHYLAPVPVLA